MYVATGEKAMHAYVIHVKIHLCMQWMLSEFNTKLFC